MVQTFILTRTFAISAFLVGALPVSYAAPIPRNVASSAVAIAPRYCRMVACLYADPTANSDPSSSDNTADPNPFTPQTVLSSGALEIIDFLISSLTSARNSMTAATVNTAVNVVDPSVEGVTVDAFVDPISSIAKDVASRVEVESDAPSSVAESTVEREVEENADLDALL